MGNARGTYSTVREIGQVVRIFALRGGFCSSCGRGDGRCDGGSKCGIAAVKRATKLLREQLRFRVSVVIAYGSFTASSETSKTGTARNLDVVQVRRPG